MKIARYLSLLIAMLLCLAFVPASAETMHVATSNVLPDMLVGIDDDELFVGFAEQKFYGYERMTFGLARENLDAKQKAIFDALKTVSTQVANGEKKTTSFNLDTKQWATVPQYQCATDVEAQLAFQADFDIALDALLFDCPYEMYWYDKVSGVRYAYGLGQTGNDYTITSLNIDMYVGAPYAGATAFTVNDIPAKVNTAADKAASIVAENQYVNDFQKLAAYKNAIC